jgi:hypothetical protein
MLIEYLTLNLSLHILEMLFDYLISYLYMGILKLNLGKIIFLQIFL